MRATTCGETPKKKINLKNDFKDFLNLEEEKIKGLTSKKLLYKNNLLINDPIVNYLNLLPEKSIETIPN